MSLCYKLDIMSHTWVVGFLPKSKFTKLHGTETLGITELEDRSIYLRIDKLSLETIIHELFHAYISETSAHTMNLDTDQMEELCCDLTGKYAKKIIEQGEQVLHAYKVLRGRRVR